MMYTAADDNTVAAFPDGTRTRGEEAKVMEMRSWEHLKVTVER